LDIEEQKEFMEKAVGMLKRGNSADAVQLLEKVYESGGRAPACLSILGLALARSGGDMIRAERLCLEAIKKEFYWAQFYRNLAEIYLLWGKKSRAIILMCENMFWNMTM